MPHDISQQHNEFIHTLNRFTLEGLGNPLNGVGNFEVLQLNKNRILTITEARIPSLNKTNEFWLTRVLFFNKYKNNIKSKTLTADKLERVRASSGY
jgi:hypothetical protein